MANRNAFKFFALLLLLSLTCAAQAMQRISLPKTGLTPGDVALIINDDDPLSQQVGEYYQSVRNIPAANVIHVRFPAGRSVMSVEEFQRIKLIIDQHTPKHVQAYAIAWTTPYRVGCMSMTSALAFGFDKKYCADQCKPTQPSAYFNSPSRYPFNDHQLRPAMMLAGSSFEQVKMLIDRGVQSDYSFPRGQIYLLNTSDKARSSRAFAFEDTVRKLDGMLPIQILAADFISDRRDVLGYFTGLPEVVKLDTLGFLPGALADHLTSVGGKLTDSMQMSSLRWLEAGATASYGAVVEPCSFPQKFPSPGVALFYYALGATAIEAYWKSVAWPGQGVFIGEPLAKPFAPMLREIRPGKFELKFYSSHSTRLRVEKSASAAGPFRALSSQQVVNRGENVFYFQRNNKDSGYIRLFWH